jgi:hypothetical protein
MTGERKVPSLLAPVLLLVMYKSWVVLGFRVQAKELLFLTGALLTQIFHNIGDFISKKKNR